MEKGGCRECEIGTRRIHNSRRLRGRREDEGRIVEGRGAEEAEKGSRGGEIRERNRQEARARQYIFETEGLLITARSIFCFEDSVCTIVGTTSV